MGKDKKDKKSKKDKKGSEVPPEIPPYPAEERIEAGGGVDIQLPAPPPPPPEDDYEQGGFQELKHVGDAAEWGVYDAEIQESLKPPPDAAELLVELPPVEVVGKSKKEKAKKEKKAKPEKVKKEKPPKEKKEKMVKAEKPKKEKKATKGSVERGMSYRDETVASAESPDAYALSVLYRPYSQVKLIPKPNEEFEALPRPQSMLIFAIVCAVLQPLLGWVLLFIYVAYREAHKREDVHAARRPLYLMLFLGFFMVASGLCMYAAVAVLLDNNLGNCAVLREKYGISARLCF